MEDKDTKLIEKILFIEALHDFPTIHSIFLLDIDESSSCSSPIATSPPICLS